MKRLSLNDDFLHKPPHFNVTRCFEEDGKEMFHIDKHTCEACRSCSEFRSCKAREAFRSCIACEACGTYGALVSASKMCLCILVAVAFVVSQLI